MNKLYLDTETVGLHGVIVLLQYAVADGPITLYHVWKHTAGDVRRTLEWTARHTVVGFNLAFDWFHIQKLHTLVSLCPEEWVLEDHVDDIAMLEPKAMDGKCLKPAGALDLMLYSRKGPYQSLMNRDEIRIRRVHSSVAFQVAQDLENEVQIDPIYDARRKLHGPKWKVFPSSSAGWCNIVRKFYPSGSLKSLAEHALGIEATDRFSDVELPKTFRPIEYGYAPTALAVSTPEQGWRTDIKQTNNLSGMAWPGVVREHIRHWNENERAQKYAENDIVYTRGLDKFFDYPEVNDDDSVLACMVGCLRWRGYAVDCDKIRALRDEAQHTVDEFPVNTNRPSEVRAYLEGAMTDLEKLCLPDTSKETLETIFNATEEIWQPVDGVPHPAGVRAKAVFDVKKAMKRVQFCDKILRAGRLHADFVVIGAKSSRMSGAGGLNAQGIDRKRDVRIAFPLAWPGYQLCGGDFAGFEVTIIDAVYKCEKLHASLRAGKKIHGLFGAAAYDMPYEALMKDKDKYGRAKSGVFLDAFGGEHRRLAKTLNLPPAVAKEAQERWKTQYPGIGAARNRIKEAFTALEQFEEGGAIKWHTPADAAYTLLGFPRFFTLENQLIGNLFSLANKWAAKAKKDAQPKLKSYGSVKYIDANGKVNYDEAYYHEAPPKVRRGKKDQVPSGTAASALFGAAFGLCNNNIRAAGNHEIQGTGAGITKNLQRRLWDLQPAGVHEFVVMPMNIHDEIMCPTLPEYIEQVTEIVGQVVSDHRKVVPLLCIEWCRKLETWWSKDGNEGASGMTVFGPEKVAA